MQGWLEPIMNGASSVNHVFSSFPNAPRSTFSMARAIPGSVFMPMLRAIKENHVTPAAPLLSEKCCQSSAALTRARARSSRGYQ